MTTILLNATNLNPNKHIYITLSFLLYACIFYFSNGINQLQAIYVLSNPVGSMKLYEFVIIFGCFMLILAQIPSFHSLRHINLVSLVLCLLYSAFAAAGSIYIGIYFFTHQFSFLCYLGDSNILFCS